MQVFILPMRRRLYTLCIVMGIVLWSVAVPAMADEPDTYIPPLPPTPIIVGDDFDNEGGSTVAGDALRGRAKLAEALGKEAYYRSLSARQFQEAIDKMLENNRERIESYYEIRAKHDEADLWRNYKTPITQAQANRLAKEAAPDRLTKSQINPESGVITWPKPLDDDALKKYRKPIDEAFEKRASPGVSYTKFDHLRVERMTDLMQRAVDSIKDKIDTEEYLALTNYLDSIRYESAFDGKGGRVDRGPIPEAKIPEAQIPDAE